MLIEVLIGAVLLGVGFALGRVKNKAKLAAVEAELTKAENYLLAEGVKLAAEVKAEVLKLVTAVRAKL